MSWYRLTRLAFPQVDLTQLVQSQSMPTIERLNQRYLDDQQIIYHCQLDPDDPDDLDERWVRRLVLSNADQTATATFAVKSTRDSDLALKEHGSDVYTFYQTIGPDYLQTRIVTPYGFWTDDQAITHTVFPFIQGQTLSEILQLRQELQRGVHWPLFFNYLHDIGQALDLVHGAHFIHGDLIHQQILITPENRALLIDLDTVFQPKKKEAARAYFNERLYYLQTCLQLLLPSATWTAISETVASCSTISSLREIHQSDELKMVLAQQLPGFDPNILFKPEFQREIAIMTAADQVAERWQMARLKPFVYDITAIEIALMLDAAAQLHGLEVAETFRHHLQRARQGTWDRALFAQQLTTQLSSHLP